MSKLIILDRDGVIKHIETHTSYPTTKKALLAACSNSADLPDSDRAWLTKKLPDGEYRTSRDVLRILGLDQP